MKPSLRRIWGLMYRHLALYRRSWPRLLELAYWPILQMCIWGFTASFLRTRMGNPAIMAGAGPPRGEPVVEGAVRPPLGGAIFFFEEIVARNLGAPFFNACRLCEMVAPLLR